MLFGKAHDLVKVGTPPSVDALGIIADCHDLMVYSDLVHDLGLQRIHALILVDKNMGESVLIVLGGLLIVG